MNSQTKNCQNCHQDFTIEPDDFSFYENMNVPAPTFCYLCRAQRRMAWRNENSLFKRKSDFSGKDIFSAFSPDSPVKVYEKDVWLSDKWDSMEYGRDYDFFKNFFEQFSDLLYSVPLKNLNLVNGVNSDYCNNFTDPKNCYLSFNGKNGEDCMYCNGVTFLKECIDTSHCGKSEKCYEGFWLTSCSNIIFSSHCESSFNLAFCLNCVGCHDCFGCVGLRKKEYYINNKQYTKEEYKEKIKEYNLSSFLGLEKIKKETKTFWQKFPRKFIEGYQNVDVSGNYISHSKNIKNSDLVREGENIKYCQYLQELPGCKDCYDYTSWGDSARFVYECSACGIGVNNIKFCYNVQENVHDIEYSYMCSGSSDLFGCVGLKKKQYCIFNKQYKKEEYFELVNKIKKHMDEMPYVSKKGIIYKYGEFFPAEFSPFAYNETIAIEYFTLSKEEAIKENYLWRDSKDRNYLITLKSEDLPDDIKDVNNDITSETISCMCNGNCSHQCTTAFKIIPEELQFYRKLNLPLPRYCFKCRSGERLKQRTLLQTVKRKCQCTGDGTDNNSYKNNTVHSHESKHCNVEFETNYINENDLLYCEKCYQQEVY
ncbi:MAG: hypothetical protein WCT42_02555 [Candidatus Paceibacterota bacterium]